jgi:hypothetical protein
MTLKKICLGGFVLLAAACYQACLKLTKNLPKPNYDLKEFWGKGDVKNYSENHEIPPFVVTVGDEVRMNV